MKKILMTQLLLLVTVVSFAQTTPTMIYVTGGTFAMGSNNSKINADEKPVHSVTLNNFSIGKYEVTVAEYKAFCIATGRAMPSRPRWGWNDMHPIVNVSFDDANAYCNWLSETSGKKFSLPTEAEWEYAARGGNKIQSYIYSGSDSLESVSGGSGYLDGQTDACGSKSANGIGLYDMSGNVWEWCSDWYADNYYNESTTNNPKGPSFGTYRVCRGGSFNSSVDYFQVATRYRNSPGYRHNDLGFRVISEE